MKKTPMILLATAAALFAALGFAGPASARPAPPAHDVQQCSPDTNGGTLTNGVCVLPGGFVGSGFQDFFVDSAGQVDVWSIVSGSIPPGLQLPSVFGAGSTILAGTPTQAGTYTFTLEITPFSGKAPAHPSTLTYSVTIGAPVGLSILLPGGSSTLPAGTVGQAYALNFFVNGGESPYTWSVASGSLPAGLSLVSTDAPDDNNNELAGTPTTAGDFTFTMEVTSGDGQQATQQFTLDIEN